MAGGAGGKGVWGAAGMVYEMDEPDAKDPNYDESAQVRGGQTRHTAQRTATTCILADPVRTL